MANVYKNAKVDFTTTDNTTVYTTPSDSRAIIKNIVLSEDSNNADSITITITNAAGAVFSLFKDKAISAKATVELITQPIILQEGDRLHLITSILEINRD